MPEFQSIRGYPGGDKGYKKLKVWERANEDALAVYKATEKFPREELYGVTSRLRKAVLSVALNIVEGQASISKKDFLNMSNRSPVESEYLLEIASDRSYLSHHDDALLEDKRWETGLLLTAFIRGVRSKL